MLVCALALSMAVPAGFVYMIFTSRAMAAQTAIMDVTSLQAGSQNLMGPVIIVPFDEETVVSLANVNQMRRRPGHMILYAETGQANAELATEIRKRGLQQVPVYNVALPLLRALRPDQPPFHILELQLEDGQLPATAGIAVERT